MIFTNWINEYAGARKMSMAFGVSYQVVSIDILAFGKTMHITFVSDMFIDFFHS